MTHHIFSVLPIKHLVNQYGEPTTSHKLATGTNISAQNLRVLFFSCVVQKSTAQVEGKVLKMRHQPQKGFMGIFFGITEHQKWHLIYVPSTLKIVSLHAVVFDETFSNELAYTLCPYSKVLTTKSEVS